MMLTSLPKFVFNKIKMRWAFITYILFLSSISCDPVVKTAKGTIRGYASKSRGGRDYYSFTGIPYAKPPIDELRFKPPVSVDPWKGILNATKDAKICTQMNYYIDELKDILIGQEDCLYLNVYSPNINEKLPVMFWIHGGGFVTGHGSLYRPDYLMDKNVVFVSLNYRLGLFGFISTEDDVIPGNYGLKDQVMALRWVQENIEKFGGDPGQVTIFGESAGGASTGYHMMSPLSKGLFHKAILQSGAPICRWGTSAPGIIRKRTEAVATIAGCHTYDSEKILSCLKKLSAAHIVKLHNKFLNWLIHPSISFTPVVESCNSYQESFLCNNPITDFKLESVVPTILGFNSGEGGVYVASLYNETSLQYPEFNTDFNQLLPSVLFYNHLSLPKHWDEIANQVRKMYFPSGCMDLHSNVVDMIGDGIILTCVMEMSIKLASPVYLYLYDYQNEVTLNKVYGQCKKDLGVSHGDEMISLFSLKEIFSQELNEKDTDVSKLMVDIWVRFASSKVPTVDGTDNGAAWPEFTSIENSSILHIDSVQPKIVRNSYREKYEFWNKLPLLSRLYESKSSTKSNNKNEL